MRFTHFKFENFKGIDSQILDLSRSGNTQVFTLVGLNESGKTTVLEAINYFAYKPENLSALQLANYEVNDIHNLIPINKRDNFNGVITIEAGVELDDDDVEEIKKAFKKENITLKECGRKITYTQNYLFENSVFQKDKSKHQWSSNFEGVVGKGRKIAKLKNEQALLVNPVIKSRIPSILYFPNFLFEFPERIYLDDATANSKHKYYQKILQDVLDSLQNDTNITDHIIKRIKSDDEKDRRSLTSLIGKMQKQLTEVIFTRWNQIFSKKISKSEIILYTGQDETGPYLEFNIKDDVDTYRIDERSLGFRWFFVYILLTQFRSYRKHNRNAIFLFDEPASNLHPSAQTELLKSFEKLSKVIYTAHSHYLINPKWLENTFVIKNEAIDYDNELAYNSKNTNIKINRYRDFAVKFPNQTSYFQPILEVLDYRPTNLELVPRVVITEGKNDFYMFSYFQDIIEKSKSKVYFIPGTSATNLETLLSLYIGWGRPFIILLDSDKEGLKQKKRYEEIYGPVVGAAILTYSTINSEWANFAAESLFSLSDQMRIQSKLYPDEAKFNKKLFNRSLQEFYVNSEEVELDESTLANLRVALDFLRLKLG